MGELAIHHRAQDCRFGNLILIYLEQVVLEGLRKVVRRRLGKLLRLAH